jgi:hypothetical protein
MGRLWKLCVLLTERLVFTDFLDKYASQIGKPIAGGICKLIVIPSGRVV